MSNESESSKKEKILALWKDLKTEGSAKNSGIELVKTVLAAGVGILAGQQLGRPSLLIGAGAAFAGHYYNEPKLTHLGIGMMASGGYQLKDKGVAGAEAEGFEGFKEKLKVLGEDVKHRLYLDKILKSNSAKPKEEGTAGLGEVQYFKYPNDELNMGALDSIEEEITRSGEEYETRGKSNSVGDLSGFTDRIL